MNLRTPLIAGALLVAAAGCATDQGPAAPAAAPVSTPTPPAATNMPTAAPAKMTPVMTEGCPDKDASHVLTEDEQVFLTPPGQGVAPVGVLKSGTKVLAMVPGSSYTKCMMGGGKVVYLKTTGLKPVTN